MLTAAVTPLNYRRLRGEALNSGPSGHDQQRVFHHLKADDSEIVSAFGGLDQADYSTLDSLMCQAYRSGDWGRFNFAVTTYLDAKLHEIAYERAKQEQERSWDDAAEHLWGIG